MKTSGNFSDNSSRSRFELLEDGSTAFADYRRARGCLVIPHVESPPALRGKGTAGRLMQEIVSHARQSGLKIAPLCGYARAWFRRHPENSDVLEGR